jgi:hypothetical protein
MRILCDQMITESDVETLASEPQHTVTRVRDELRPDATDDESVSRRAKLGVPIDAARSRSGSRWCLVCVPAVGGSWNPRN